MYKVVYDWETFIILPSNRNINFFDTHDGLVEVVMNRKFESFSRPQVVSIIESFRIQQNC